MITSSFELHIDSQQDSCGTIRLISLLSFYALKQLACNLFMCFKYTVQILLFDVDTWWYPCLCIVLVHTYEGVPSNQQLTERKSQPQPNQFEEKLK